VFLVSANAIRTVNNSISKLASTYKYIRRAVRAVSECPNSWKEGQTIAPDSALFKYHPSLFYNEVAFTTFQECLTPSFLVAKKTETAMNRVVYVA
jgi:hypothetical protein